MRNYCNYQLVLITMAGLFFSSCGLKATNERSANAQSEVKETDDSVVLEMDSSISGYELTDEEKENLQAQLSDQAKEALERLKIKKEEILAQLTPEQMSNLESAIAELKRIFSERFAKFRALHMPDLETEKSISLVRARRTPTQTIVTEGGGQADIFEGVSQNGTAYESVRFSNPQGWRAGGIRAENSETMNRGKGGYVAHPEYGAAVGGVVIIPTMGACVVAGAATPGLEWTGSAGVCVDASGNVTSWAE